MGTLDLPLNLSGNRNHAFYARLRDMRAQAAERARSLPVPAIPAVGGSQSHTRLMYAKRRTMVLGALPGIDVGDSYRRDSYREEHSL